MSTDSGNRLLARLAFLETHTARLQAASAVKRLQRALGYYLDHALWDQATRNGTANAASGARDQSRLACQ